MSVLERAQKHYADLGRLDMEVPEWGCTVFWTPFTLEDGDILARAADHRKRPLSAADILILKAQGTDGKPLFQKDDRDTLMKKVDRGVVVRIANKITAGGNVDDAEKNSETIAG